MVPVARTIALGSAAAALAVLAACGSDAGASSKGGSPELTITSPADGATVGSAVRIQWKSSVKLGPTDTGRDHVHVFVDGKSNDYTVVGGNEFMLKGLSPGQHTLDVTLQHADHSPAGAEDAVKVDVDGSGSAGATTPPDDTSTEDPGPGYGY
jgi:hypothetical protein